MNICNKIARKFTFKCDFVTNGLHYATVASGELCQIVGTRRCPKIQPCRLMQMGCIMSPKVQLCSLIRGRSPHIRHLFAASFRFLSASHTIRLPLEYHSVTIRLALSTSRQGDRVIKTEKGAFQVTLRAPSNSFYVHCPEWYSGNPKRSAPPLVVYPAALPKFITCQLSYTSSASDRSSECEIRIVNCQLSIVNCQFSTVNC